MTNGRTRHHHDLHRPRGRRRRAGTGRPLGRLGPGHGASPPAAGRSRGRRADRRDVQPLSGGAGYRLTQLAFVQEHALTEAQNRIQHLEASLQQAQRAAAHGRSKAAGFFSGLFPGGGQRTAPPPQPGPAWNQGAPPPQYAQPQYVRRHRRNTHRNMPPATSRGCSSAVDRAFFGSALTTAPVLSPHGLVVGNALMGMFERPGLGGGFGSPGGFGGGSPWGAPAVRLPRVPSIKAPGITRISGADQGAGSTKAPGISPIRQAAMAAAGATRVAAIRAAAVRTI